MARQRTTKGTRTARKPRTPQAPAMAAAPVPAPAAEMLAPAPEEVDELPEEHDEFDEFAEEEAPTAEDAPQTLDQSMEDLTQSLRDFQRHMLAQNSLQAAHLRAKGDGENLPVFKWTVADPENEFGMAELVFDTSWLPPEYAAQMLAIMANGCRAMFQATVSNIHDNSGHVKQWLKET